MAKTIEEIFKEFKVWQEENPKARSFMAIVADEKGEIRISRKGKKSEVVASVASAIANSPVTVAEIL